MYWCQNDKYNTHTHTHKTRWWLSRFCIHFLFEEGGFALLFGLQKKEFLVDNYTSSYYYLSWSRNANFEWTAISSRSTRDVLLFLQCDETSWKVQQVVQLVARQALIRCDFSGIYRSVYSCGVPGTAWACCINRSLYRQMEFWKISIYLMNNQVDQQLYDFMWIHSKKFENPYR